MPAPTDDSLKALAEHAAAVLGPIASILVEQAAETGASFEEVRREVAGQMDEAARAQFISATEPLASKARKATPRASPPQSLAAGPATGAAAPASADTLDRSDPGFVQGLARYLATSLGAEGENMVSEAARRCRTKMQLCMRLANAVSDPALKDMLLRRALEDSKLRASRKG